MAISLLVTGNYSGILLVVLILVLSQTWKGAVSAQRGSDATKHLSGATVALRISSPGRGISFYL